jgi:hypothetical protein
VPLQPVARNFGQPGSEAFFEIASSAIRIHETLSPAGVVDVKHPP